MDEITLRPYQSTLANSIRKALSEKHKHIMTQLPTGGGKTIIFTYIAMNAIKKGNKVLILTDRNELLKQASKTMISFGGRAGFIKASAKVIDYKKDAFIGMAQTLRSRINDKKYREFITDFIDIIIIDEAHIQEFNFLFEDGILNDKIVLAFTATPSRSGKMRQLGLDYEKMIQGPTVRELISKGFLLNCDIYEVDAPNMNNVSINAETGDYNASAMFKKFDNAKSYSGLVTQYRKHVNGTKMIVFCVNIEHCIKTCIELNKAGIKAKFVASEMKVPKPPESSNNLFFDGTETEEELAKWAKYNDKLKKYNDWQENFEKYSGAREDMFNGFRDNEFEILVNVDIATKGYDEPSIVTVAVYRATTSLTLWLQMIGRGSRLFPGKDSFNVLDFGGNKERLGGYDIPRSWSLWHEQGKKGNGVPPLKECGVDGKGRPITSSNEIQKGCKRLIMASVYICPFCGFKYPAKGSAAEVELTLASVIDENGVSLQFKSISKMTWEELETYRRIKKHKSPWLWRQLWDRGGEAELKAFAKEKYWSDKITNQAVNYCKTVSKGFNFN